jgi:hypothetical protein
MPFRDEFAMFALQNMPLAGRLARRKLSLCGVLTEPKSRSWTRAWDGKASRAFQPPVTDLSYVKPIALTRHLQIMPSNDPVLDQVPLDRIAVH